MSVSRVIAVSLVLVGAGCATSGPPTPRPPDEYRLADGTQVVCRMEADTGSNIRQRVCRKVEGTSPVQRNDLNQVMTKQGTQGAVGN